MAHETPEVTVEREGSQHHKKHAWKGYALAVLAACGWSTGGLISHIMMTAPSAQTRDWLIAPLGVTLAPTTLSGARAALSTVLLVAALLIFDSRSLKLEHPRRDVLFLAPFGALAMAGMHFTYFKAIATSNVTTAILLEYLAPILTLLYGVVVLRHKVSWRMALGVALSILGCAIVVGAFNPGGLMISTQGLMWGLMAAFFFALYSTMGGRGGMRYAPFTLLVYGLLFAALMWLVVLGPREIASAFATIPSAIALLVLACLSTIIPFAAYLNALKYISPTQATIAAMLEPVVAALSSWALFGDPITWSLALGGALILGAIALVQLSQAPSESAQAPAEALVDTPSDTSDDTGSVR